MENQNNNPSINKKDMLLESPSGFMMPFPGDGEHDVEISLGYGQQTHPATGQPFHHNGIDLIASNVPLFACASGAIVGAGNDAIHENYIVTRYGKYEVKYGHVSEAYADYGTRVVAGQQIATSGKFLHFEVKFNGQLIDPIDFLTMLYNNVMQLSVLGIKGQPQLVTMGVPIHTDYDADQNEILELMFRWLPEYMNALRTGAYHSSDRVESSLRNIFQQSAQKNYFFEQIPSLGNPLGLSERSSLMAGKVQNLLIGDFLAFLASRHNIFVSSWDDAKKKLLSSRFQTAG